MGINSVGLSWGDRHEIKGNASWEFISWQIT